MWNILSILCMPGYGIVLVLAFLLRFLKLDGWETGTEGDMVLMMFASIFFSILVYIGLGFGCWYLWA